MNVPLAAEPERHPVKVLDDVAAESAAPLEAGAD